MDKVFASAAAAVADIPDGATILATGFGLCGNPENLIRALLDRGTKDLTIISNNCGTTDKGLGVLLAAGRVKKMISSYVGENKVFEKLFLEASSRSSSTRRARSPSASAPAAPASAGSTRRRGTARSSPRARRRARSTARCTSS